MASRKIEVRRRIAEIRRRLDEMEKNLSKVEEPGESDVVIREKDLSHGFSKILGILDRMLREGSKEYIEVGIKKKGGLEIEHGLRIKFLDDKKRR